MRTFSSPDEPSTGRRARPGGRSAAVVAAVRKATYELLAERGYAGLEIPDIAARAGVNRTTVYRRWPTKAELLLDVLLQDMATRVPTPDTGSFQQDLEQLLLHIARLLRDPAMRGLFHLLADMPDDEATASIKARFWDERLAVSGQIVSRAIVRGDVADGVSPRAVLELGAAPLFYRMLILGKVVEEADVAHIAQWVARQDLTAYPAFAA